MALSAYRTLLRSIRIAFEGDSLRLDAAKKAARNGFDTHRHLAPNSDETSAQIEHATSVGTILRQNVVQGRPEGETDSEGPKYRLRIHNETERGSNDSIKKASKSSGSGAAGAPGVCCSSR